MSKVQYYNLSEKEQHKRLQKGDVLFNWRSGSQRHVGKTALFDLDGDFTCSSFILRFRVDESLINHYLANYLHKQWAEGFFVQNRSQSSVNSVFNKSASETIPIAFPNKDEQKKIAYQMKVIDEKITVETQRKNSLEALFQTLLHHLMTGKLRTLYPAPDYFIPTREPAYAVRETDPEVHVEALLIAALVNAQYQVSQHPVSRFRVTKLSYLYNSFTNRQEALENFGIYNFGPYNPQIRYGGVEETLQALGYLEQVDETHFQPGAQIGKAVQLASEYYTPAQIAQIVEEFGEFRDRTLELWTTVEYTARQIYAKDEFVSAERVFEFWRKDAVWQAKTEKFTVEEIKSAMQGLKKVFRKFQ